MFSRGIKWIILRSRFFLAYRFASKDDKPFSATFGQISSKSNGAFSIYMPKKHDFFTLIPYNPRIKIFFKKIKTSLSSHYQVTTLCQKLEHSYERFSRSPPALSQIFYCNPPAKSYYWVIHCLWFLATRRAGIVVSDTEHLTTSL